jgi:selenocysteine lyase/cysteine desulfurase
MVSLRKDFVRFSPHLYNQPADIQQALDRIEEIL